MAYDIFRKNSTKDFARGEPPPSDSYEWAGTSLPPPGRPRKAESAGTTVVIVNQKKSILPWVLGLTGIGAIVAWWRRRG